MSVKLPDGRELADQDVVVDDLFIVALGDLFASGESNPDRPVQFSAAREMVYDPIVLTARTMLRTRPRRLATASPRILAYGLASKNDQTNPKVLPRRLHG